jgi:hypothetical protein
MGEPVREVRRLLAVRGWSYGTTEQYSPEVRERAVEMVFDIEKDYDSQWGWRLGRALARGGAGR